MVAAGAIEGAILGYAQGHALRPALPGLDPSRWIALTAAGAAAGWIVGLGPGTQYDRLSGLLLALVAGLGTLGALIFLLSVGGAQWFELRRHVRKAGWWIPANALAWTAGVNLVVVAMALVPNDAPAPALAFAAPAGGLAMAVAVALIAGRALVLLMQAERRRAGPDPYFRSGSILRRT